MNRILEGTAIEYSISRNRKLDPNAVILTPVTLSAEADIHLPRSKSSIKAIEIILRHDVSVLLHNLKKFILLIKHLGTGRIDEKHLTTRDPWLEVYRFRKNL